MPKDHEKYTEDQMYKALASTMTVSGAAQTLDCSRSTVYEYMKRYPGLHDAIHDAREMLVDMAEGQLAKNVKAGHPGSVFFVLGTQGKPRGYVKRIESTGADGGPIQHQAIESRVDDKFDQLTTDKEE